jgi:hypothetical protein
LEIVEDIFYLGLWMTTMKLFLEEDRQYQCGCCETSPRYKAILYESPQVAERLHLPSTWGFCKLNLSEVENAAIGDGG